jgi:outer membrane biosynthesis protein TonB
MSKHKKTFTILGLLTAIVILAGAIFFFSQPPIQNNPEPLPDEIAGNVEVDSIGGGAEVKDPVINPDPITAPEASADEPSGGNIPLTVIEDKPLPPEKPEAAQTDEPHEPPTDPALTNPDKKPDSSQKPAETVPPKDNTPQSGDKDGNGNIYIPGFGWVKDEGGGGQGEKSQLDPEHPDFDKIIGQ